MDYQLSNFVEELEYLTGNTDSHQDLIRDSAKSMRKLLENTELFTPEYLENICKGEECGKYYHSKENNFVIQIFAWDGRSKSPVHDHDGAWGIMGIYQNKLKVIEYSLESLGKPGVYDINESENYIADKGGVCYILSPNEDIHAISNPTDDLTVSIHVYGKPIKEYNIYDLENNKIEHKFVSEI